MLCSDFENNLTDYLDGALDGETHRSFAEHALRCPVCHETLSQVRSTLQACRVGVVPPPSRELEARILQTTVPESAMTCSDFEDSLTDYLDGFLPAPLYHRWERHAVLCARCTELPGEVVRAIGACYTYINEERPLPVGLNERILQATLGTITAKEMQAPPLARVASWLRSWLDPIVSPQLATVASMLLIAVFVLTNTVSADGSIGGVYRAGLRLAEQGYSGGNLNGGIKGITDGLKEMVGGPRSPEPVPGQTNGTRQQHDKSKQNNGSNQDARNDR